jgi:hypothetical protein
MMNWQTVEAAIFDQESSAIQREHEMRLRQLCEGKQPTRVVTISPCQFGVPQWGPYDMNRWLAEALEALLRQRDLLADRTNFRSLSFSVNRAGHHFVSAALGCQMGLDGNGTLSVLPQGRPAWNAGNFHLPEPEECPLVREALEAVSLILDTTRGRIPIELPHIPSPLLLAVDLFGEEFLVTVGDDDPASSRRCMEGLTRFGERLLDLFVRRFPGAPLKGYFTGGWNLMPTGYTCLLGCTTHLISAVTYRDLVADLDQRLLRGPWRGGCIHLCGHHTQHCPAWAAMPELKALQLNDAACDDLETYYRNLRADQFFIVMPNSRMTVEACLRVTGGRRLVLSTIAEDVIPVGTRH